MGQIDKELTLARLLNYCCDVKSSSHDFAWREFLQRYKMFMYKITTKSCMEFNVPRLNRQLSETVNDIIGEVFVNLCNNHFKALSDYQAVDNEKMFLAWLAIICKRTTSRNLKKYFRDLFVENDPEELHTYLNGLKLDTRWIIYDDLVTDLRACSKTNRENEARDIHIFMLYKWEQFSQPMIMSHPCLRTIGHRVIEVVVARMLRCLRQQRNF